MNKKTPPHPGMICTEEAAFLLEISNTGFRNLCKKDKSFLCIKTQNKHWYRTADIEEYKRNKEEAMQGMLSARQSADMLGLSYTGFFTLIKKTGLSPHTKIARQYYYKIDDIKAVKKARDTTGLICEKQAAYRIGVSCRALAHKRHRGKSPVYIKISRRIWYKTEDINEFIEKANPSI